MKQFDQRLEGSDNRAGMGQRLINIVIAQSFKPGRRMAIGVPAFLARQDQVGQVGEPGLARLAA